MWVRNLLAPLCVLSLGSAKAGPEVYASVDFPSIPLIITYSSPEDPSAQGLSKVFYQVSWGTFTFLNAIADISYGQLLTGAGSYQPDDPNHGAPVARSAADARFSDTFRFGNFAPGSTVTLGYSVVGELVAGPYDLGAPAEAYNKFHLDMYTGVEPWHVDNFHCVGLSYECSSIEPSGRYIYNLQGEITIPIQDLDYRINIQMSSFSSRGHIAAMSGDFSETGISVALYLRAPEGITLTSSSGAFLTNAITAVPEPPAKLLFGLGLLLLPVLSGAKLRRNWVLR